MKLFITAFCLAFGLIGTPAVAGHHAVTMKFGGDWVDVVAVSQGDFMRMAGVFRGTNKMTLESGDIIITNFTCPGYWDASTGGAGACNMREPATGDHWALSWDCDANGNCVGDVKGGSGRFEGANGSMTWVHNNGWGEGAGTFMLK